MLAPLIDEQKIRDIYGDRFGCIDAERAAGTADAPFAVLALHELGRVTAYGYATLGASRGPLQHEVVIDAIEPFPPYGAALEAVARQAPPLAPGAIVPHVIPNTPFTALLCLPFDDTEGSFTLGKGGTPPYAFRLAPLTTAERALAEREPEKLLDLLRFACALTADRYRSCLVDVAPPPPAARTETALQRRQTRAALLKLQEDVLREHGPRTREDAPITKRLAVGSHGGLLDMVEHTIRVALRPYVRHPAPVVHLFAEFIYVTLATHPDAARMMDRAIDPRNLPRSSTGDLGQEAADASRRVVEALAIAIARSHPEESEAAILAHGQPAIRDALSTFDPADEIPLENHVWATVLPVMYEGLEDLKRPAVRYMPKVFRHAARNEAILEYEPDPRPPLMRVREIAARLATELVTAYAADRRGQLPG